MDMDRKIQGSCRQKKICHIRVAISNDEFELMKQYREGISIPDLARLHNMSTASMRQHIKSIARKVTQNILVSTT